MQEQRVHSKTLFFIILHFHLRFHPFKTKVKILGHPIITNPAYSFPRIIFILNNIFTIFLAYVLGLSPLILWILEGLFIIASSGTIRDS